MASSSRGLPALFTRLSLVCSMLAVVASHLTVWVVATKSGPVKAGAALLETGRDLGRAMFGGDGKFTLDFEGLALGPSLAFCFGSAALVLAIAALSARPSERLTPLVSLVISLSVVVTVWLTR